MAFRVVGLACALTVVAGCGLALDFDPPSQHVTDGGAGDLDAQGLDAGRPNDAGDDGQVVHFDAMAGDATTADAGNAGCAADTDCGAGEICVSSCVAGEAGHCIPAGEPCSLLPTCGCDGVIYDSICSAHQAGFEPATDPSLCFGCGPFGTPCSGPFELCLGCPGTPPTCVSRPDPPCTDLSVCGCDGNSYASNCDAEAAGVLSYTMGACSGECVTSLDCHLTEYCARADCGDTIGVCQPLGTTMTGPVCGCSGRRYRSAREALRREGVVQPCDRCSDVVTPPCCVDSSDCAPTETCVGASQDCSTTGVCEPLSTLPDGACWSDEDCAVGAGCVGAFVCPCGATCFVADMPGTCMAVATTP
jgi:hypothetical protein